MSSDEDDSSSRQREFQTSFEEDGAKPSHRAALYMTTSPNTLSKITAKASDDSDKMDISSPYTACESACESNNSVECMRHTVHLYFSGIMANRAKP